MKRCPYCHYANSENNTVCYHCKASLEPVIPHEAEESNEEPVRVLKRKSIKESEK